MTMPALLCLLLDLLQSSNSQCPGNNYCAVMVCVDFGLFKAVIEAITDAYNEVGGCKGAGGLADSGVRLAPCGCCACPACCRCQAAAACRCYLPLLSADTTCVVACLLWCLRVFVCVQVSDEVQKLYKITMKASQGVPGLLKSLGDAGRLLPLSIVPVARLASDHRNTHPTVRTPWDRQLREL